MTAESHEAHNRKQNCGERVRRSLTSKL